MTNASKRVLTHAMILEAAKRLHALEIDEPWDSVPDDAQAAYLYQAEPIVKAALDAAPIAAAGRVADDTDPRTQAISDRYSGFYDGQHAAKAVCDIIEHLERRIERALAVETNTWGATAKRMIAILRGDSDA